jgi:C1A family cysteine protease
MKGEDLPAALDWRNINEHDRTTPIKNQRTCGSCWDFAAVAVAESQFDILSLDPRNAVGEILSEQYVLSHCSDYSPKRGCDGGWPDSALVFLTKWGTTTEAAFPYNTEDSLRAPLEDGSTLRLGNWGGYINRTGDLPNNAIKEAVYKYGPVLATMAVYKSFFDYTSGVYEPVEGDKKVAYHAVTIVGWDDDEDAWICKNSWSRLWGDNGWFRIKQGTCGINSYVLFAYAPA